MIVAVNAGSSSIKCGVFAGQPLDRRCTVKVERIGQPGMRLAVSVGPERNSQTAPIDGTSYERAIEKTLEVLREHTAGRGVQAIGHRVVHGGVRLLHHQVVTDSVLSDLKLAAPLDPLHLPREISLIEACVGAFPGVPQVACFDTVFHRDLPRVAQLLPIPRRFFNEGIRRYGFHGLSFTFLMSRLSEIGGPAAVKGRVILAHLGSGASMAAVVGGVPFDTTMGFTPNAGLVMGTRPGDMDPGLLAYLLRAGVVSADGLEEFLSTRCGLLGISETSADIRDLLTAETEDPRAAEAVELFCYEAKKHLGSLAAAMGGVDTVVFSGGIGEHSPEVRARICAGLGEFGLLLDRAQNSAGSAVISTPTSQVTARVISTDEERVVAQIAKAFAAS